MNSLSVKTQFGWITAIEANGKIIRVKFDKNNKNSKTKSLIKFKKSLNNYFKKKNLLFLIIKLGEIRFKKKSGVN